jgi:hypothetical protein
MAALRDRLKVKLVPYGTGIYMRLFPHFYYG